GRSGPRTPPASTCRRRRSARRAGASAPPARAAAADRRRGRWPSPWCLQDGRRVSPSASLANPGVRGATASTRACRRPAGSRTRTLDRPEAGGDLFGAPIDNVARDEAAGGLEGLDGQAGASGEDVVLAVEHHHARWALDHFLELEAE